MIAAYASHIQNDEWGQISTLMESRTVADLKALLVEIIRLENERGANRVMNMIFGKRVTNREAKAAPESIYVAGVMREMAVSVRQQGFRLDDYEILGAVPEGKRLQHVVVKITMSQDGESFSNLQIYSFRKERGKWKMLVQPNIQQVLQMIEFSYKVS